MGVFQPRKCAIPCDPQDWGDLVKDGVRGIDIDPTSDKGSNSRGRIREPPRVRVGAAIRWKGGNTAIMEAGISLINCHVETILPNR